MKKGEMGVGTLIIFIAMLLVAAVAAGVLIQTVSSLQEQSLATGQQARTQISTNAEVIEVSATDGRDKSLTDFQQLVKLSPGSDPIRLNDVIFTFNTKDETATLKYRGEDSTCDQNNQDGYNTWNVENPEGVSTDWMVLENDYDDDNVDDYVRVANGTTLSFNISSYGIINVTIPDISAASEEAVELDVEEELSSDDERYGTVTITGETSINNTIDDGAELEIVPYRRGEGYFSAVYEQQGTNWVNGNLQRGDIIRLCYEAPGEVGEDQIVRLNFIPKIGTPTLTEFATPDVISTQRVYLYP